LLQSLTVLTLANNTDSWPVHRGRLGFACLLGVILLMSTQALTARASALSDRTFQVTDASSVLVLAEQHFRKGETCFNAGNMEGARREFDLAIDTLIDSGIDIRGDASLSLKWRELIERINRFQTSAVSDLRSTNWKLQEFEGLPAVDPPPIESATEVLGSATFRERFAELRNRFRNKFGRDITLTGADHSEHRRLYGIGSAFDIRARDLNTQQIKFIISVGSDLGLRVKDFSSEDKVAAHNARVFSLGRPLDTLATGVHLHIDGKVGEKKKEYAEKPASKQWRGVPNTPQ
jgi:hypothetical protein